MPLAMNDLVLMIGSTKPFTLNLSELEEAIALTGQTSAPGAMGPHELEKLRSTLMHIHAERTSEAAAAKALKRSNIANPIAAIALLLSLCQFAASVFRTTESHATAAARTNTSEFEGNATEGPLVVSCGTQTMWNRLGDQFFLMPDPRKMHFTTDIFMGYEGGGSFGVDEYGRQPNRKDAEVIKLRDKEWKTFHKHRKLWESKFGELSREELRAIWA